MLDELILSRRSIRKYANISVDERDIEQVVLSALNTAMPSSKKIVRIIRIKSEKVKQQLCDEFEVGYSKLINEAKKHEQFKKTRNLINAYYRFSRTLFDAPEIFMFGYVSNINFSEKLKNKKIIKDSFDDSSVDLTIGLSLQNFMLKSVELKLSTCIMTAPLVFIDNIESIIGVKDIHIKSFITLGYSDEILESRDNLLVSEQFLEL